MRVTYGTAAKTLLDRGFQPIPVNGKVPEGKGWQVRKVDKAFVDARRTSEQNVGIRTGQGDNAVYGVDIDFYDAAVAQTLRESFEATFGKGVARIGQAPKVLLLYRGAPGRSKITSTKFESVDPDTGEVLVGKDGKPIKHGVEILGQGQQFVGFGVHPDTGKPYTWEDGSPLDIDAANLPALDLDKVATWVRDTMPTLLPKAFQDPKKPAPMPDPSGEVDDRTMADLRDAMKFFSPVDSDIYDFWINIGQALKSTGRPEAWELWHGFSKLSPRYDFAESEEKWNSFDPNRITYRSIFYEAKKRGWENKNVESDRQAFDVTSPAYTEFTVDGFLSIGVTIVAGAPGVGKTNLLVPLACHAAHLCPQDSTLRPTLRRKVIYVTEDPRQVKNILYAMHKHVVKDIPPSEWSEWFVLEQAHRRDPKAMATLVASWRQKYGYKAGDDLLGYWIEPLIVLDTSNATLELESENDNSEAGRAVAAVKEALGGASVWLVAHVAKMDRNAINNLTARGASAFEGDANGVAYIIHDDKVGDNVRHMVLGKHRFQEDHSEIEFQTKVGSEVVDTPWGKKQTVRFIYGTPSIPTETRAAVKARIAEDENAAIRYKKRQRIISFIESCGDALPNITDIRERAGVNANEAKELVAQLVDENAVLIVRGGQFRGTRYRLNPSLEIVDTNDDFDRV